MPAIARDPVRSLRHVRATGSIAQSQLQKLSCTVP
jgi:hypothetical protein